MVGYLQQTSAVGWALHALLLLLLLLLLLALLAGAAARQQRVPSRCSSRAGGKVGGQQQGKAEAGEGGAAAVQRQLPTGCCIGAQQHQQPCHDLTAAGAPSSPKGPSSRPLVLDLGAALHRARSSAAASGQQRPGTAAYKPSCRSRLVSVKVRSRSIVCGIGLCDMPV